VVGIRLCRKEEVFLEGAVSVRELSTHISIGQLKLLSTVLIVHWYWIPTITKEIKGDLEKMGTVDRRVRSGKRLLYFQQPT